MSFFSLKRSRGKRRGLKWAFRLFFPLLAIGGAVYFFYIPQFRIESISTEGNYITEGKSIIAKAEEIISKKCQAILPCDNIFILPKDEIKKALLESFPRLSHVDLDRQLPNRLVIRADERQSDILYCTENDCYFIDGTGLVFEKSPTFSENVYTKIYHQDTDPKRKVPFRLLSGENFDKLLFFKGALEGEKIAVSKIFLLPDNMLKFVSRDGWYLQTDLKNDQAVVFENFKLAYNGKIKESGKELDYVDLRLLNKVYYKFKN